MILDAGRRAPSGPVRSDVAVIGAGAAGITLARALAGGGATVVVLESGGFDLEPATQALAAGDLRGGELYDVGGSRLRQLGGTTNHWTGWCRPLDAVDFTARPWIPHSGWPFDAAELAAYYPAAQALCEVGPEPFDLDSWRPALEAAGAPLIETDLLTTRLFRISPPTRFGTRYRRDLEEADGVTVWLHANVVNLRGPADGSGVTALDVATLAGEHFAVHADTVVVAVGGIETPRVLLASRDARPEGLGNRHDLVGRFFMDHPHAVIGAATLDDDRVSPLSAPLLYGLSAPVGERTLLAQLGLRDAAVAEHRLAGLVLTLAAKDDHPDGATRGSQALVRAMGGAGHATTHQLFMRAEPVPDPSNRVVLTSKRDALGMPRVALEWRTQPLDREHISRTLDLVAREVGRAGLGRMRVDIGDLGAGFPQVAGGNHHVGTLRMHDDPARGVVDADGRVHGTSNLYVAGSAVFPTAGYANPTLTIVALALRLARHLGAGA